MNVNGQHKPNISCRKCKHRHPADMSCADAAKFASIKSVVIQATDSPEDATEYLVVGDANSAVLLSTTDWTEAVRTAGLVRRGGGFVTIFKSTKG